MVLSAELQHTRDVDRGVRLLLVRDGRVVDVPILRSYLNEKDRPTYEYKLLAPLAEISYQFFLADASGSAVTTPRYTVRRKCLPSLKLTSTKSDGDSEQGQKAAALAAKAEALDQEIKQYDSAIAALDELEKLLKE